MSDIDASAAGAADEQGAAAAAPVEQGTDQSAAKETVTADDVAKVLHLKTPAASKSEEKAAKADKTPAKEETPAEEAKAEEAVAAEEDATAEDEQAEEEPAKPAQAEAQPTAEELASRFSFTVEGSDGKTYTIRAGDNLDDVLADFQPKSNGQVLQIIADFQKVNADKTAYDADQATKAAEAEHAQHVNEFRTTWDNEVKDLTANKRLPSDAEARDARVSAVYKYMADVNEKRMAAGRPVLTSFEDALDKLELQERREADAKQEKEDKETARRNGGLVGGSSAPATSAGSVYRAGSARNASEAVRALGLLS